MRELFYDRCVHTGNTELLGQWDERNAPLTPKTVSYGSKKKLWWHCRKGHSWQAAVYNRSAGSGCPYCAGKAVESGGNDLASVYPELAKQWDAVKNAPLTPADVTPHTHRKVWWKCPQGHEWQASVHSRAQGTGCPICTNHIPVVGENTLADRFPQIAQEWDYEKNAPLTPEQVLPGTSRRVWWICPNGHSCRTNICSRTSGGNGCPICAGKAVLTGENDLQTKFPEIAAQWDWEKNTDCTPDSVAASSNRRVWWRCEQGHSFCTSIAHRVRYKSECPYCTNKKVLPGFNDLATVKPRLAAQWDPELNGTLTPQMVTAGSHQKVWWKCPAGHRWKAAVYSRAGAQENGCPVCAGRTQGRNIKW